MRDQKTINAVRAWADIRRQKSRDRYQENGSNATLRTAELYDDICDICNAAEDMLQEEDMTMRRIIRMQRAVFDDFFTQKKMSDLSQTFSWDEVEKWMRKMSV